MIVQVAGVGDIPEGAAVVVPAALTGHDDDIAVFCDGGRFFALDDTCSHARASLSQGWVEDGSVECPLHSARFALATGAAESLPATRGVRAHRVEVVDGQVIVHPGETPVDA